MSLSTLLKRIAAEPFVHFIVLGALIFACAHWLGDNAADRRIELGPQDLQQLRAQSRQQWGREPSVAELQTLLQARVREEVLVREALAQGLDRDDVVVRRRLAQKMEFLNHAEVEAPTPAQLQAFYAEQAARYTEPPRLDLEQLHFPPNARAQAETARRALVRGDAVQAPPQMLPGRLRQVDAPALARDFGAAFSTQVFALAPGVWSAPLASAQGLHLVRVSQRTAATLPPLAQVEARVRSDWANAQAAQARDSAYAQLLRKYTVVLPPVGAPAQAVSGLPVPQGQP